MAAMELPTAHGGLQRKIKPSGNPTQMRAYIAERTRQHLFGELAAVCVQSAACPTFRSKILYMGKKKESASGINGPLAACGMFGFMALWILITYFHYSEHYSTPNLEGYFPVLVVPAIVVFVLVLEGRSTLQYVRRFCGGLPTTVDQGIRHED